MSSSANLKMLKLRIEQLIVHIEHGLSASIASGSTPVIVFSGIIVKPAECMVNFAHSKGPLKLRDVQLVLAGIRISHPAMFCVLGIPPPSLHHQAVSCTNG